MFQSRSRIKNPEAAVVSQKLARFRRCLIPTESAFDNESETMFLKTSVHSHSIRSRDLESRYKWIVNRKKKRNESISQSMRDRMQEREHPGDVKTQKKSPLYFNDEKITLEKY